MAKRASKADRDQPNPIRFGREICGDLAQAERREWWLANGMGGYAAGTVAGTLTRRYHGLLIAPVNPPLGRHLVFAKADASLVEDQRETPLYTNRWDGGVVDPSGYLHLESFHLDGRMPVWRYAIGHRTLEARIWMERGEHTTCLAYRLSDPSPSGNPLQLRIRLLANARDHHASAEAGEFAPAVTGEGARLTVGFPSWFALHFLTDGGAIEPRTSWIANFDLPTERERGLPDRDNHLCVGEALLQLKPGEWVGVTASLGEKPVAKLSQSMQRALDRDLGLLAVAEQSHTAFVGAPDWVRRLILSADDFVFKRTVEGVTDGRSIIAGYPWFGDWGRDTMIALPGLTIACGQFESARKILATFAEFVDRGMLPNVFPGAGDTPEYNTVDAALWYVEAWRAYVEATNDWAAVAEVFPTLAGIINAYRDGTRYGIHMDPADGLIYAGESGVQLTWMDAKVGDWVVTPRQGKPVEIAALWYNALCIMADFADKGGYDSAPYRTLAKGTREGFQRFVRTDGAGLHDVLDTPAGIDATIRPNQIFAVSLQHSPLDKPAQRAVVGTVGDRLLTSYGLRSLDPADPAYKPHYQGGVLERDGSYHQGPVWVWLLGHYALAEHRTGVDARTAQQRLSPIRDHLFDAGLGTVSEILDGAEPHLPRGCPAQAWSVACVLDAWLRLERAANEEEQKPSGPSQRKSAQ
ncbi:MAG TPA: amylo-alpha-1,6-glucosidase [Aliidongia sp.]|uniref:amylo-alpha-1,6-glucosidase n=1 Tax=Aliidongia sp. TaxID=1914230 RepID=UPI002DDCDF7D|nr:amylo-alpha-1,6-glucosidase [Aliidongia sp.]HEV2673006.1 amylo-alpha-1,6-glucosidase [Aliidongia sp.]